MDDPRIEKARYQYYVCKSNALVREARYSLSLLTQRLISYICMLIKPGKYSNDQMKQEFELADFYHTMGLKRISSTAYANARNALNSLLVAPLWLPEREQPITWLSSCDITEDNHVTVVLHKDLGGHLLDLMSDYTRYNLADISDINSAYGLRLYEYFRSYLHAPTHSVTVKLETLRKMLMIDEQSAYQQYSAFNQRVLKKAIDEINKNSDIKVEYFKDNKRNKVKVEKLHFCIASEDFSSEPKKVHKLQFGRTSLDSSAESKEDDLPF